ncbi:aminotransferase class III-fold pyridoxal phosphate-dependent enzyme [Rhodobacteraceae bacterium KMM 6894]|nr:aminotransferase class III-fold pyridoxal phosphate-dependent enzyme [Rhodobacteraceae bacterium KMM 6894]
MHTPQTTASNSDLDDALTAARHRFAQNNPKSLERHRAAAAALPGGNTRAVLYYPPFPLTFTGGDGCRVHTLDGQTLIDMVSEYTAGIYGHSNPVIAAALKTAIDNGLSLGGPNTVEARYASVLTDRFPAYERVRFCNSGTEANIMALSMARAITGRPRIIAMTEGYHGGVLSYGHGGSVLNLPFPMSFATYNNVEGTRAMIRAAGDDLAAVILEPMLGGGGCIPATPEFLEMIRSETRDAGALMIFDEVMTSRLDYHGLHGALGITPDLVTMGKYLGGGASFGCFGGRADLMDRFDPSLPGAFSHGGTFNNNILSMSGGMAGLTKVLTAEALNALNARGDALRIAMQEVLARHKVVGTVSGRGSMMALAFVPGPVSTPAQLEGGNRNHLALMHVEMLLRGFYIAPRGMIALSLPYGPAEADAFLAAFDDFLAQNHQYLPSL